MKMSIVLEAREVRGVIDAEGKNYAKEGAEYQKDRLALPASIKQYHITLCSNFNVYFLIIKI